MQTSKETKILNSVCVGLVLAAGFVRLMAKHYVKFSYNILICMLFMTAIFIWIYQIQRRLLQPDVRKNLTAAALLMIFWMVTRTMKYEFFFTSHAIRYGWYLYYIPMNYVPVFMFRSVLYVGRSYHRPISRLWNLLYLPAAFLALGVLTNDFHQLAFYFPKGIANWNDWDFIRGPFYYGTILWMAVLFISMLIIVFYRCGVPANRKKIWIPMVPLFIEIIYTVLIVLDKKSLLTDMLRVPEIGCFLLAAFMECLIIVHLFPSNDCYGEFWNASTIGAGIMDLEGKVRYQSECSIPVTKEQVFLAETGPVLLNHNSIALRSHRIQGGFGYWTRDMREINRLNEELSDMGDVLAEENAILEAENKIAEQRSRIRQQNALYDSIAKSVSPQLDKISNLLDMPMEEEQVFEQNMKYACILNSYVKRYSNLLLLHHQKKQIDIVELQLAITESLEYVRLYGMKAYGAYYGEGMLPGETLLLAYELFQAVLESAIPGATALLVNLNLSDEVMELRMELSNPGEMLPGHIMQEKIAACNGTLDMEMENRTEYISLILPKGGEAG